MKNNQLEIIVKESGLEAIKAKSIINNFQNYFDIAADWEIKAKTVVVTNENQLADMKMARVGRLFLREKRIAIENARKELKEQSLREGKAIDGIANILKALIIPIEEYLDKQEHFIEIKQEQKRLMLQAESDSKEEADRIAKEESDRKEQERIRVENEKMRKELDEKEKIRIQTEAKVIEEKRKLENEKVEIEEKARKEKEDAENKRKAAELKLQEEKRKLQEELDAQIECPNCHHKFNLK